MNVFLLQVQTISVASLARLWRDCDSDFTRLQIVKNETSVFDGCRTIGNGFDVTVDVESVGKQAIFAGSQQDRETPLVIRKSKEVKTARKTILAKG
jgi:hypothetical protein